MIISENNDASPKDTLFQGKEKNCVRKKKSDQNK